LIQGIQRQRRLRGAEGAVDDAERSVEQVPVAIGIGLEDNGIIVVGVERGCRVAEDVNGQRGRQQFVGGNADQLYGAELPADPVERRNDPVIEPP
jgi:hypothetical protein